MVTIAAAYCPNCAALLSLEPGITQVRCEYCEASLTLSPDRVTHERAIPAPRPSVAAPAEPERAAPIAQPDPSLVVRNAARFRTRIIEQRSGGPALDLFEMVELDEDRFALVSMRCVDDSGSPVAIPLGAAWSALRESLEDDGDPGLAANLALEALSALPQFRKLECAITVLDPARTTAQIYCAGCQDAVLWVSTEEARPILAGPHHQALERADLAKSGSQFDNGKTIQLAALDLLVVTSFAYLGDAAMGSNVHRLITQALRDHLGEDPQRIVTLIKNEFWDQRESGYHPEAPLAGDLRIAAVGARLAEPKDDVAPPAPAIQTARLPRFEISAQTNANVTADAESGREAFLSWSLSGQRHCALLIQAARPMPGLAVDFAREAVHSILNNMDHGDFDNPRAAGRKAYAALEATAGVDASTLRMVVVHGSDEHHHLKYFVRGWKAALILGPRGLRPESQQQQFDEGGEITVAEGARLFFPGTLPFEGEVLNAAEFAERWHGGKSSHLYEALRLHWRTRKTEKALVKLVRAAALDTSPEDAHGLLLISGI